MKKILITFVLVNTALLALADDNKFQQYNQKIYKPNVYHNYFPTPLGYYYGNHFFNSYYYHQEAINERNYYLDEQDKETYTSPDEFKIKKD